MFGELFKLINKSAKKLQPIWKGKPVSWIEFYIPISIAIDNLMHENTFLLLIAFIIQLITMMESLGAALKMLNGHHGIVEIYQAAREAGRYEAFTNQKELVLMTKSHLWQSKQNWFPQTNPTNTEGM